MQPSDRTPSPSLQASDHTCLGADDNFLMKTTLFRGLGVNKSWRYSTPRRKWMFTVIITKAPFRGTCAKSLACTPDLISTAGTKEPALSTPPWPPNWSLRHREWLAQSHTARRQRQTFRPKPSDSRVHAWRQHAKLYLFLVSFSWPIFLIHRKESASFHWWEKSNRLWLAGETKLISRGQY